MGWSNVPQLNITMLRSYLHHPFWCSKTYGLRHLGSSENEVPLKCVNPLIMMITFTTIWCFLWGLPLQTHASHVAGYVDYNYCVYYIYIHTNTESCIKPWNISRKWLVSYPKWGVSINGGTQKRMLMKVLPWLRKSPYSWLFFLNPMIFPWNPNVQ